MHHPAAWAGLHGPRRSPRSRRRWHPFARACLPPPCPPATHRQLGFVHGRRHKAAGQVEGQLELALAHLGGPALAALASLAATLPGKRRRRRRPRGRVVDRGGAGCGVGCGVGLGIGGGIGGAVGGDVRRRWRRRRWWRRHRLPHLHGRICTRGSGALGSWGPGAGPASGVPPSNDCTPAARLAAHATITTHTHHHNHTRTHHLNHAHTHTHTHTHTTPHHPPARSTWNTPLVSTLVWMLTLPADTRVEGGRGGAGEGRGGAARWAGGRQRAGAWLAGGGTRAAGLRPAQTEASRPAALTTPRQAAATRAHDPPPLLQRRALPSPESLYRAATSAMPDTLKAPSGKARRQQGMAPAGRAAQQRARGSVLDCGGGGGGGGGRHAAPQGRSRAGLMPRECSVHNPPPFPSRSAFTPSHTHTHTHTTRTIHAHRPPSPGALSKCRVNASESAVRLCRCTARLVGMRRMAGTSTRGPPGQAGREKGVAGGAGARA